MDGGAADLAVVRPADRDAAGRADAFRRLVDRHLDAAYVRASVLLGNRFEAEDAVHDAAERAWRQWGSLQDPDRFEAWFGRILLNVCRDRLRRRRRVSVIEAAPGERGEPPTVGDATATSDERDRIRRLLGTLSADDRIAVVLRYASDLTVPTIATLLAVPEGTVKSRLHRALRQLRIASQEVDGG
jgi:RNA polymerase sigma-70 factor (ECF subfamily)